MLNRNKRFSRSNTIFNTKLRGLLKANNKNIPEEAENKSNDLSVNQNNLKGKMTHVIILSTEKVLNNDEITIKLLNRLPAWVERSSTDNDTNLGASDFATTTFGFKYLMNGIYESYKKLANGTQPVYFTITLKLNK